MSDTATPSPASVSRFEYNLLRLTRFLVGQLPASQVMSLVQSKLPVPPCLSRTCVEIVEDTLAKGCILHLIHAGAWRHDRTLRNGQPCEGRLWDRHPLEDRVFSFSAQTMRFLIWLTAEKPTPKATDLSEAWERNSPSTAADDYFLALAFHHLSADPEVALALSERRIFQQNPLLLLWHPEHFLNHDDSTLPDFSTWLQSERAIILEAMQPMLCARWIKSERSKSQIEDWGQLRKIGEAEARILRAFSESVQASHRFDLARFLLNAANTVLAPADLTPTYWTGGLKGTGPNRLADRLQVQQAALAFVRHFQTLELWERNARNVGYFDEDYAVSQYWKTEWENANGSAIAQKARSLLETLQPLRTN